MANEINFGYPTGETLTFSVYTSAGVTRETGSALTETPASSGLYLGTPAALSMRDQIVIKESTTVVGHGEWMGKTMSHGSVRIVRNV
ncbi:unnamed protein product [marine sediment metagenome]|uniref:Uncharacterized protein n=1 Tax=marine sediment metagenome TaxID=412755 RepID=X1EEP7_9ZZZZ